MGILQDLKKSYMLANLWLRKLTQIQLLRNNLIPTNFIDNKIYQATVIWLNIHVINIHVNSFKR